MRRTSSGLPFYPPPLNPFSVGKIPYSSDTASASLGSSSSLGPSDVRLTSSSADRGPQGKNASGSRNTSSHFQLNFSASVFIPRAETSSASNLAELFSQYNQAFEKSKEADAKQDKQLRTLRQQIENKLREKYPVRFDIQELLNKQIKELLNKELTPAQQLELAILQKIAADILKLYKGSAEDRSSFRHPPGTGGSGRLSSDSSRKVHSTFSPPSSSPSPVSLIPYGTKPAEKSGFSSAFRTQTALELQPTEIRGDFQSRFNEIKRSYAMTVSQPIGLDWKSKKHYQRLSQLYEFSQQLQDLLDEDRSLAQDLGADTYKNTVVDTAKEELEHQLVNAQLSHYPDNSQSKEKLEKERERLFNLYESREEGEDEEREENEESLILARRLDVLSRVSAERGWDVNADIAKADWYQPEEMALIVATCSTQSYEKRKGLLCVQPSNTTLLISFLMIQKLHEKLWSTRRLPMIGLITLPTMLQTA